MKFFIGNEWTFSSSSVEFAFYQDMKIEARKKIEERRKRKGKGYLSKKESERETETETERQRETEGQSEKEIGEKRKQ